MTGVICAEEWKILKAMPDSSLHSAASQMLAACRSLCKLFTSPGRESRDRSIPEGRGAIPDVFVCRCVRVKR